MQGQKCTAVALFVIVLSFLSACSETEELMAVRTDDVRARGGWNKQSPDDRPRVVPYLDNPKASFSDFVVNSCSVDQTLDPPFEQPKVASSTLSIPTATAKLSGSIGKSPASFTIIANAGKTTPTPSADPKAEADWKVANKNSHHCALKVASYAVDQCDWMTVKQNNAAITVNLLTGAAFVGAALTTDGIVLAHPNSSDKITSAALAAAVTSNSSGFKNFITPAGAVNPSAMVLAADVLAEATGLTDPNNGGWSRNLADQAVFDTGRIRQLAHLHDQILSMCAANALGIRKPARIRG